MCWRKGPRTVAYSYIGSDITWPIYWHGALGKAKEDLDRASAAIDAQLAKIGGGANVAVLKSVVTQASSAIPVMPLYLAMVFKVMREKGLHEGCMDQIYRMFSERLYNNHNPAELDLMIKTVFVWMIGNYVKTFSRRVVIFGRR